MNGMWCSRVNEVRINISTNSKVSNVIKSMRRFDDVNLCSLVVEKSDSKHVNNAKNRVVDGVGCCFRFPFGHCCTHIKICSDSSD